MKSLYAILGIDPVSPTAEIKSAYRRLVKKYHPDKGGDPVFFCDIRQAYDTLSNPKCRADYDRERNREPFAGDYFRPMTPHVPRQPVDVFDDLIEVLSRRFGYESEAIYNVDIVLTPVEAAAGINLELRVPVERICDRCFGFGGTLLSDCGWCGGIGILHGQSNAYLRIEPGARSGDSQVARSGDIVIRGIIEIRE